MDELLLWFEERVTRLEVTLSFVLGENSLISKGQILSLRMKHISGFCIEVLKKECVLKKNNAFTIIKKIQNTQL